MLCWCLSPVVVVRGVVAWVVVVYPVAVVLFAWPGLLLGWFVPPPPACWGVLCLCVAPPVVRRAVLVCAPPMVGRAALVCGPPHGKVCGVGVWPP